MNKERYLQKIKKLLNLGRRSTNPNEAGIAIQQAQKLMAAHNISAGDVDLLEISEFNSKGAPSNAASVPTYMADLCLLISRAFGVRYFCTHTPAGYSSTAKNVVTFFGPAERPQIAAYAFDVLSRQMMNGRREYIGGMRSNTKPATKTARGDTFCEYWIIGAYQAITPLTVTEAEETLIAAYRHKLTESQGLTTKDTRPANKCRGADGAANAGYTAGKNAKLNQGVSAEQLKIGGAA
ncbi:DUF2786 domain-containing protein [Serratia sp. IR-2025]